jgi:hypothetical protein
LSIEAEGTKPEVVELLPHAQEQHDVLGSQPLPNQGTATVKVPDHVGQRDAISLVLRGKGNVCPLLTLMMRLFYAIFHSMVNGVCLCTRC